MSISELNCIVCGNLIGYKYPPFPPGVLPKTAEGVRRFREYLNETHRAFCSLECRQTRRQQIVDEIMGHAADLSTETLEKLLETINRIKGKKEWV